MIPKKIRALQSNTKYQWMSVFLFVCLTLGYGFHPTSVLAQNPAEKKSGVLTQVGDLVKAIEVSIASETSAVEKLKEESAQAILLRSTISSEIDLYNVQQTKFNNLLFLPEIQLQNLESAFSALNLAFAVIKERYEKLSRRRDGLEKEKFLSAEQFSSISKQRSEGINISGNRQASRTISNNLATLQNLVSQKQNLQKSIQVEVVDQMARLEEIKKNFSSVSQDYEKFLTDYKSRNLFHRDISPFSRTWPPYIANLFNTFYEQVGQVLQKGFWTIKTDAIQKADRYDAFSFTVLFFAVLVLCWRLSRFLKQLKSRPFYQRHPSIHVPLTLIKKNLFLLGVVLYLYVYVEIVNYSGISEIIRVIIDLSIVWLVTGWGLDLVKYRKPDQKLGELPVRHFIIILWFIRCFIIPFLILLWIFQYNRFLFLAGRVTLELALTGFGFLLWRKTQKVKSEQTPVGKKVHFPYRQFLSLALLSIAAAGLLLELAGYGSLALFWYLSWGRSLGVILWVLLLTRVIKEMNQSLKRHEKAETEGLTIAAYQARWISIRLIQLTGPIVLVLALMLAWGGKKMILSNSVFVITYHFQIGDMKFSVLSFLQAALVLLGTHVFTRLWRYFFQKRFLDHSRMEHGLQESIKTLTIYVIWVLGIIISMNVFGLNPTSLVVIFGALGIGLGFGLQNIFNNFMSGLILLFERPIQVGDDIEINGTWATVKKINVRSTLVQTYDNASLIIPNSDLINTQVTNWSFKDKRLRRPITVGVAYGSDIELVRKTLLEISQDFPNVLKYPAPDVLFLDFGDSALIFKLRFWTYIDGMFETETNLRFEIDRRFREKKITIAFPQQDVHLFYENPPSPADPPE